MSSASPLHPHNGLYGGYGRGLHRHGWHDGGAHDYGLRYGPEYGAGGVGNDVDNEHDGPRACYPRPRSRPPARRRRAGCRCSHFEAGD
jgi:hypothetical protein